MARLGVTRISAKGVILPWTKAISSSISRGWHLPEGSESPLITPADIGRAPTKALVGGADGPHVSEGALREALIQAGNTIDSQREDLDRLRKSVNTTKILDDLINPFAHRAFGFMCIYCGVVATMVIMDGFRWGNFNLPNTVLNFLVGSTATTVIGLVGMVLTGVFVGARGRDRY